MKIAIDNVIIPMEIDERFTVQDFEEAISFYREYRSYINDPKSFMDYLKSLARKVIDSGVRPNRTKVLDWIQRMFQYFGTAFMEGSGEVSSLDKAMVGLTIEDYDGTMGLPGS